MLRVRLMLRSRVLNRKQIQKESMPKITGSITVEELQHADRCVIRYVQKQHFMAEVAALNSECVKVNRCSSLIKLDHILMGGLICVGGWMKNASHMDVTKHQIILHKKSHHVVNLIVEHYHIMSTHAGTEHVLSLIRQRYWLIRFWELSWRSSH